MNMGSRDKRSEWKRLGRSFACAYSGLKYCVKHERNMQIHIGVSVVVLCLAYFFKVSKPEFLLILLLIGIVLSLEAANTAIEKTVDLISEDYHPLAKIAKDAAAGAVFLFAIISVMIGTFIFYKPMLTWVKMLFH